MLGNDADALDATQDALLAAVRSIGRFDGRSSFGTWLYRIATNACLDELRRRRRRPIVGLSLEGRSGRGGRGDFSGHGAARSSRSDARLWVDSDLPSGLAAGDTGVTGPSPLGPGGVFRDAFAAPACDPADIAAARIDVDTALARLTADFRTAIVLRDVCDLPYEEIAEILGVPIGTVRSRIARGRAALADLLSPESATEAPQSPRGAVSPRNEAPSPDVKDSGKVARVTATQETTSRPERYL